MSQENMSFLILENTPIATDVKKMVVASPDISRKHKAGQFVIVRTDSEGERIPLTIADSDAQQGAITLIYQIVGKTTAQMGMMGSGQALQDLVGPLGKPTEIERFGTVVCVGGGIGVAPIYPIVKAMKKAGNRVISIMGAKSADRLFYETELKEHSDVLIVVTDDGSKGQKGWVTHALDQVYDQETRPDRVIAIGPAIMMQKVSELTRRFETPTIVSLNPIMVDGTGMCGGCRVVVEGEAKFACVDGPEFDGHAVDFENLIRRLSAYKDKERASYEAFLCQLKDKERM